MNSRRPFIIWLIIASVTLSLSCGKDGGKSPTGPSGYSITGRILEGETGLSGCLVTIKVNEVDTSVETDENGRYTFIGLDAVSYTATPSKENYIFRPKSLSVVVTDTDQNLDDIVATKTYKISGRVLENGTGLSGVQVQIYDKSGSSFHTTTVGGSYFIGGFLDGNCTVIFSLFGYTFSPRTVTVTISGADVTVSDITATKAGDGETYDLTFASIPGGTFRMGDIQGDGKRPELPVHYVTLDSFEMSIYEVTNTQYITYLTEALATGDIIATSSSVTGVSGDWSGQEYLDLDDDDCDIDYSGGTFTVRDNRENHPVIEVTRYGAKAFAEYYGLDLPTEAEWEYACRAGTETKYYSGNSESDLFRAGWYEGNADDWTHPVGQKEPNAWGLYDMLGNVFEWCNDLYDSAYYSISPLSNPTGPETGTTFVIRSGNWGGEAYHCRSASRTYYWPDNSDSGLGFRVVRRLSGVRY
jgi:formylglycine-generating enzyme